MKLTTRLKRWLCLRRHHSTVPTGLVPLSELHSAIIYLDKADDLSEPQKIRLQKFYADKGVSLSFIHADDEDLRSSSDLFISLSSLGDINERYAAGSSTARFKVGRHQLKRDVYDFVVTDNSPEPREPMEAYNVIEQFLINIQ